MDNRTVVCLGKIIQIQDNETHVQPRACYPFRVAEHIGEIKMDGKETVRRWLYLGDDRVISAFIPFWSRSHLGRVY